MRGERRWVHLVTASLIAVAAPARAADPAAPADAAEAAGDGAPQSSASASASAPATIQAHRYTLVECLALADRNFPNLWAARSRLAAAHAQLDEAFWTPLFQWTAQSAFGVAPALTGTVLYTHSTPESRNLSSLVNGLGPFVTLNVSGVLPLYTFGQITAGREAADANVRVSEWDMEKTRQQTRMDVRRAFYGLQLARDLGYVADDAISRLDHAVAGVKEKIAKGDPNVTDIDRLRLETFRQQVVAQSLQAPKSEAYALAALRFMTGVDTNFDIVDEPLERPTRPLAAIVQYLEAARLLRPDVNMARAGVVAREHLVDLNRAKLFPQLGLALGADYASTPSAVPQQNVFAYDNFNHFYYYVAFGARWSLDILPQAARAHAAEAQLEETRALERLALGNAMFEVEKAYADVVEAKTREATWDTAEHEAKEWISIVQDRIDLGTSDERDLLEPLRAYGNARVQHLTALMDLNVALSSLALASGWDAAAP